ncbi:MAG TPA: hypothetical protein EYN89_07510 [Flavobacteriales bacterium]|nr:hypothetical protein [Flavobacteriales bacterium]
MFKKIISTFASKFLSGILSLLIVIFAARYLGAEGRGIISLLMLNITIVIMFNNLAGGGALIYAVPRENFIQLLLPSYFWALITSLLTSYTLTVSGLSPPEYGIHLFLLSFVLALVTVNGNLLLGLERINEHNFSSLFQVLINLIVFYILLNTPGGKDVQSYIKALYCSFSTGMLLTSVLLFRKIKKLDGRPIASVLKAMFKNGFFVQIGGIFQLLNYRLSYYLLEVFHSTAVLGVYSTAVSLIEALWLISKSISMVQYARISNSKDLEYSRTLTIKLIKFTFVSTLAILLILIGIPESAFLYVLGNQFSGLKEVLLYLSAGIVIFSISGMFSHYLSGTGKFHVNTKASGIGFIITVIGGFILIPEYKLMGAGITATLSYTASTIYQAICFCKITSTKPLDFVPVRGDFHLALSEFRSYFSEK